MIPASLTSPALKVDTAGIYEGGSVHHPSILCTTLGSRGMVLPLRATSLLRFIDNTIAESTNPREEERS